MAIEKRQEFEKKKEFEFRGIKLEELKAMDIREIAKYLDARARRSLLRHFDIVEKFVAKCRKTDANKQIKTSLRDLLIVPQLVGYTIAIHNGKEFTPVKIEGDMIGHRLGEFAMTRRPVKHGAPGIGATKSSASMSVK